MNKSCSFAVFSSRLDITPIPSFGNRNIVRALAIAGRIPTIVSKDHHGKYPNATQAAIHRNGKSTSNIYRKISVFTPSLMARVLKKGEFVQYLEKTKVVIDLWLKESE